MMSFKNRLELLTEKGVEIPQDLINDIDLFERSVSKMREYQKRYFKTRSSQALSDSKKMEKNIDKFLDDMGYNEQTFLF